MNLYPPMPFGRFAFGCSSTPPFIQLGNCGITGLEFDMFYLSEYDDHDTVKHTITHSYTDGYKPDEIARRYLNPMQDLQSVSYIDIYESNIRFNHL